MNDLSNIVDTLRKDTLFSVNSTRVLAALPDECSVSIAPGKSFGDILVDVRDRSGKKCDQYGYGEPRFFKTVEEAIAEIEKLKCLILRSSTPEVSIPRFLLTSEASLINALANEINRLELWSEDRDQQISECEKRIQESQSELISLGTNLESDSEVQDELEGVGYSRDCVQKDLDRLNYKLGELKEDKEITQAEIEVLRQEKAAIELKFQIKW